MKKIGDILKEFSEPRLKEVEKLSFLGIGDKDVYNISRSFEILGEKFLFGRVEPRDNSELSQVFLFKEERGLWVPDENFDTIKDSEDPFVSFIDGKLVLGCVEVRRVNSGMNYRIVLYTGESPYGLKRFFEGIWGMKDVRLIQLPNRKIAVFSRPQGKKGGMGKIGFLIVDSLERLNGKDLYEAPLLDQFCDPEWGGANDIHLLNNGKLGVLGHIAKKNEDESLSYYPMFFTIDTQTMTYSEVNILFKREHLPRWESKNERLKDVIFPGGLIRNMNGTADIYFGTGDAEAYRVVIADPFLRYEN